MTVQIVPDGIGQVRYLVFYDQEPWVGDLETILEDVLALDQARIFLLTTDCQMHEVHIESTDGYPDYLDWEVTLVDGGELVERGEYAEDHEDPAHAKLHIEAQHVNGFLPGV